MEEWVNFECLLLNWINHIRSLWKDPNTHHRSSCNRGMANWRPRHQHWWQQQQNQQQWQQQPRQFSRHHNHDRAAAAKRLQKFYRSNQHACFVEITSNNKSPPCWTSVERLEKYFHQPSAAVLSSPLQWLRDHQSADVDNDQLTIVIIPKEVSRQLWRLPSHSSPGLDNFQVLRVYSLVYITSAVLN